MRVCDKSRRSLPSKSSVGKNPREEKENRERETLEISSTPVAKPTRRRPACTTCKSARVSVCVRTRARARARARRHRAALSRGCEIARARARARVCRRAFARSRECGKREGKKVVAQEIYPGSDSGSLSAAIARHTTFASPPCNHRESVAAAANYVS